MTQRQLQFLSCALAASAAALSCEPAAPDTDATDQSPAAWQWAMTHYGIGKIRAGMSADEARALLPSLRVPAGIDSSSCYYPSANGLPAGVGIMMESGRVGRIDVDSGDIATAAGARIGDTEERVKALYPARVRVSRHKYTTGNYLTVSPDSPADSAYSTIFETDGTRVLNYRVGLRPQVEYVERCG